MVNASGDGIWETEDAIAIPPGTSWDGLPGQVWLTRRLRASARVIVVSRGCRRRTATWMIMACAITRSAGRRRGYGRRWPLAGKTPGRTAGAAGSAQSPSLVPLFLRLLVPPLALPDPGANLPAQPLLDRVGRFPYPPKTTEHIVARTGRHELGVLATGQLVCVVHRAGERPPPPPVVRDDGADPVEPDGAGRVALSHRVGGEQVQDVLHILLVDLHNLELREQQVGHVERERHPLDPIAEFEDMAHLERVHKHVDRPAVRRSEVELLVAIERVETPIRLVSEADKQLSQTGACPRRRR